MKTVQHFEALRLTERDYRQMTEWFLERFPEESAPEYGNRQSYQSILKDANSTLVTSRTQLKTLELALEKVVERLERKLKTRLESTPIDEAIEEVIDRIGRIEAARELYAAIGRRLTIPDDDTVLQTELRGKRIYKAWKNFRDAQSDATRIGKLRESAKKRLQDAEKRLLAVTATHDRVTRAISVLRQIIDDPKEQHLSNYLEANLDAIRSIFSKIHVPREFRSLTVHVQDAQIVLEDLRGKQRRIEHISSGQRTALTLAIFLTLNQAASRAPRLLIFDDPVTYVDDLNTLAFFDYLREIAIVGDRQIIFATANAKLANLFDKKFDFLGESYKRYDLLRGASTSA